MKKEEIDSICEDFRKEYGDLMLLRANIAAINTMLISRGRDQELYGAIEKSISDFKAKIAGNREEQKC